MNPTNPLTQPNWDELLLTSSGTSFFHTSEWARVLAESYGYTPLYFTDIHDSKLTTLIPMMEVNSFLTGKRGVSLPFSDFCEPIVSDSDALKEMMKKIISHGKNAGWRIIDLRGGKDYMKNVEPSLSHYTHDLDISKSEQEVFKGLKDSTRRNIKKAVKEGVEIRLSSSLESVKEFYRLNCMTRKRHGLPPQPFRFFKKIHEHIIEKGMGFLSMAVYNKKTIAGAIYFHFGKNAIYKYGASDMTSANLRPNNLVMWEAIRHCITKGFSNFSFGITEMSNEGLLRFKRGWGVNEQMINYYKYNLKSETYIKDSFRKKTSYPLFQKMPGPILNLAGAVIYKHFG